MFDEMESLIDNLDFKGRPYPKISQVYRCLTGRFEETDSFTAKGQNISCPKTSRGDTMLIRVGGGHYSYNYT